MHPVLIAMCSPLLTTMQYHIQFIGLVGGSGITRDMVHRKTTVCTWSRSAETTTAGSFLVDEYYYDFLATEVRICGHLFVVVACSIVPCNVRTRSCWPASSALPSIPFHPVHFHDAAADVDVVFQPPCACLLALLRQCQLRVRHSFKFRAWLILRILACSMSCPKSSCLGCWCQLFLFFIVLTENCAFDSRSRDCLILFFSGSRMESCSVAPWTREVDIFYSLRRHGALVPTVRCWCNCLTCNNCPTVF